MERSKKTDQSWDEVRWNIKFKNKKKSELLIATMNAKKSREIRMYLF